MFFDKFLKPTIALKFSSFVLVLITFTGTLIILIGVEFVRQQAYRTAVQEMESEIFIRSTRLKGFLNGIENRFELIGSRTRLRELIDEKYEGTIDEDKFFGRSRKILKDAREPLAYKDQRKTVPIILIDEIGIYTSDGTVLTSTRNRSKIFFESVIPEKIELSNYLLKENQYLATVQGQIITPKKRKLGLFLTINITKLVDDFLTKKGLHKTGRIALARFEGKKLTPIFNHQEININNFENHLNSHKKFQFNSPVVFDATNNNLKTLNMIYPLKYQNWYVAVQLNSSEVNEPIKKLINQYLWVVVPTLFFALLLASVFSRYFTKPIKILTKATEDFMNKRSQLELPLHRNDEIGALSLQFKEMAESIQKNENELKELYQETLKSSQLKDQFLSTITHELRNPASIIIGYINLMMSKNGSKDEMDKYLEIISKNAHLELKLVEDLLEASRLFTGQLKIEPAPISLKDIVCEVIENVQLAIQSKAIELSCQIDDEESRIFADKDRMIQVIWNLMSNAIRHTGRGGRISIKLDREGPNVLLYVEDNGEGIDPSFLPYIFDKFRQEDSSLARKHPGLGIGLALVKGIIEAHGGQVKAESEGKGKGSKFTLSVPLLAVSDVSVTSERKGESDENKLRGMSILVVDDMPDALELIKLILQEEGAIVHTAGSVKEALQVLMESKPEFLISDINMPGEDGYALIRQVRERKLDMPAVALTALAGNIHREKCIKAGFQDYMAKPVRMEKLLKTVTKLYRQSA